MIFNPGKQDCRLKDVLLSLAENYVELTRLAVSPKRLWYWEYYKSIEDDIKDAKLKRRIYQQIYHMERFGYFDKKGFSEKALDKISKLVIGKRASEDRKKKWDGKWRVVIFDIPEKSRKARDGFRDSLKRLGFRFLQHSIWVCPFGDFDDIQQLAKDFRIEKCVVLMVVDQISNDLLYKKKFNLL